MGNSFQLTRQLFLECNWHYDNSTSNHYGCFSVWQHLVHFAEEMEKQEKVEHAKVLRLLADAALMTLIADSPNQPFRAYFQSIPQGIKTAIPDDFSEDELRFFEDILDDIEQLDLKARIADLLWLLGKPRKIKYVQIAIDLYIDNKIDENTWYYYVNTYWKRAIQLCLQINDPDRLDNIKEKLFTACSQEYSEYKFILIDIVTLLNKCRTDNLLKEDVASLLYKKADLFKKEKDFDAAIKYFSFSVIFYKQCFNKQQEIKCLVNLAECWELQADLQVNNSNITAQDFYEKAYEAYRKIPVKFRHNYNIQGKIAKIYEKMNKAGQDSFSEMESLIRITPIDISKMYKSSIEHVAEKLNPKEAIMYFTGLFPGADYNELFQKTKTQISRNSIQNITGMLLKCINSVGHITAKKNSWNIHVDENDPHNQNVLYQEMHQYFFMTVQFVVHGHIIPALHQLCKEHRFTEDLMIDICRESIIVPEDQVNLLGYALWLGFEYKFHIAIHLLGPLVENMVRQLLKRNNIITTIITNDIENEKGLSTLMDMKETEKILGQNLCFEIKNLFTESCGGFNFRNEVAHGLLNDNSASSYGSVYAWWFMLRLVICS